MRYVRCYCMMLHADMAPQRYEATRYVRYERVYD